MDKIQDPHISFVMPAYNCEKTIAEAVFSILQSNFQDGDELIIVNDGSTDNTENVIFNLQKKYPEIKLVNNEVNIGCPAARNVGIRTAKNPLIFNMDADDVLEKNSIVPLRQYLLLNNADMSAFSESRFFQKKTKNITHKWVIKGGILTLADFLAGPITPGGNFLYTKASWEKVNGYWEYGKGLHEFWGFTLKQLVNGAKFMVLKNSYYFHRYGTGDSLFVRESKKESASSVMATKMIMNYAHLLRDDDVQYIKSDPTWFDKLTQRPIRLRTNEVGQTGQKIFLKKDNPIVTQLRNRIPKLIFNILKKGYHYIKD